MDYIVCALPANALSKVIDDLTLGALLSKIEYVDVIVVNLVYSGKHILNPGFGFLVPQTESKNTSIIGVVFDSCSMPSQDMDQDVTRLTVMMGGHSFERTFGNDKNLSETYMLQTAMDGVKKYLGIDQSNLKHHIVSVQRQCIPQYKIGHKERIDSIMQSANDLGYISLVGASYKGVSINDIINNSKLTADHISQINKSRS